MQPEFSDYYTDDETEVEVRADYFADDPTVVWVTVGFGSIQLSVSDTRRLHEFLSELQADWDEMSTEWEVDNG